MLCIRGRERLCVCVKKLYFLIVSNPDGGINQLWKSLHLNSFEK